MTKPELDQLEFLLSKLYLEVDKEAAASIERSKTIAWANKMEQGYRVTLDHIQYTVNLVRSKWRDR